jgi:hypothetical protein
MKVTIISVPAQSSRMSEDPGVGQGFHGRDGRAQARR